jgi:hypothetical protein
MDEDQGNLADWYPDCAFDNPEDYDALMFHHVGSAGKQAGGCPEGQQGTSEDSAVRIAEAS